MSKITVTYDRLQHTTAVQAPQGKKVACDACPATGGRSEEISPLNLLGAGLSSCMLFAMGAVAQRHKIDLTGTQVDIEISTATRPIAPAALPKPAGFAVIVKLSDPRL